MNQRNDETHLIGTQEGSSPNIKHKISWETGEKAKDADAPHKKAAEE